MPNFGRAGIDDFQVGEVIGLRLVGVQVVGRLPFEVSDGLSHRLRGGAVDTEKPIIPILVPDQRRHGVEHHSVFFQQILALLLRPLPLGEIAGHGGEKLQVASRIVMGPDRLPDGDLLTIIAEQCRFARPHAGTDGGRNTLS